MADVGIRNWKSFSNGYAASALGVMGNFHELRSLLTTTRLDDDNLQFPSGLFPVTVSVNTPAAVVATHADSLIFYVKIPSAIGPVGVVSLTYAIGEAGAGLTEATCTVLHHGLTGDGLGVSQSFSGRSLTGPIAVATIGAAGEDTTHSYNTIPAGTLLSFVFYASGGAGADRHSATLWLKTQHLG